LAGTIVSTSTHRRRPPLPFFPPFPLNHAQACALWARSVAESFFLSLTIFPPFWSFRVLFLGMGTASQITLGVFPRFSFSPPPFHNQAGAVHASSRLFSSSALCPLFCSSSSSHTLFLLNLIFTLLERYGGRPCPTWERSSLFLVSLLLNPPFSFSQFIGGGCSIMRVNVFLPLPPPDAPLLPPIFRCLPREATEFYRPCLFTPTLMRGRRI